MTYTVKILILAFFSMSLLTISCKEPPREGEECKVFREAILADPYRVNYLFTVEAAYKGEKLRILTSKDELISLLQENDSAEIASLILNDSLVRLNDSTITKVIVLRPQKDVDIIILGGKEKTIKAFFSEDGWRKKSIDYPKEANLIDALTKWCVLVYQDDESGFLRLEKHYPPPKNYVK